MFFPNVNPIVAIDRAFGIFERTKRKRVPCERFRVLNIGKDRSNGFTGAFFFDIAFDEYVRLFIFGKLVVHIIPIGRFFARLERDNIVAVANGHAEIGVVPHNVGNNFARLRGGVNGKFNIFHNIIIIAQPAYFGKRFVNFMKILENFPRCVDKR